MGSQNEAVNLLGGGDSVLPTTWPSRDFAFWQCPMRLVGVEGCLGTILQGSFRFLHILRAQVPSAFVPDYIFKNIANSFEICK